MYLCGAQKQRCTCIYIVSMLLEGTCLFFAERGEEGFEFKRFKAISQGVARRIVGSQTPIDRRFFFSFSLFPFFTSPQSLLSTVALDPFSLLLASLSLFGCDLLRTFKGTVPPCRKGLGVVPFDAENFVRHEKWCRHARSPSRFVSSSLVSTRAAGIASFVVCDNNFYDAHWLSEERRRYCGSRRGKPHPDERGLGRAFHKIPRVICFKRARGM